VLFAQFWVGCNVLTLSHSRANRDPIGHFADLQPVLSAFKAGVTNIDAQMESLELFSLAELSKAHRAKISSFAVVDGCLRKLVHRPTITPKWVNWPLVLLNQLHTTIISTENIRVT